MSLLCRLGRHRPRGIPRWNDGLYFATCARCGRDLVRTAFEGWRVPKGYRIVWSDRPPASRPDVALIPEESGTAIPSGVPAAAAESAYSVGSDRAVASSSPPDSASGSADTSPAPSLPGEPSGPAHETFVAPIVPDDAPPSPAPVPDRGANAGRLPIQDVLAHLHAEEAADRARAAPPPQADIPDGRPAPLPAEPPPARRRRPAWDFMDDPFEEDSSSRSERAPARAPEAAVAPLPAALPAAVAPPADGKVEPPSRKAGGLPEQWRKARSAVRSFFSGPEEPRPLLVTGLALAVAVMVALALYAVGYPVPGSSTQPSSPSAVPGDGGEGGDPFAASAPNLSSPDTGGAAQEVAYVSASLLICREAPDDRARRVRNLLRGREVRVLGYDGAWASLAYRGGQCWAQAQYLSPVPPI